MSSINIISEEQYLSNIPLIIHSYLVAEFQFQLQIVISKEQLTYYCHTETGAIFIQPDIDINAEIIAKEDVLPFMVMMNLKVMKMLHASDLYIHYRGIFESQIELLMRFIQSDYFSVAQRDKLKSFKILNCIYN